MKEIRRTRQEWYGVLLAVVLLGPWPACPGRAATSAEQLAARVPEGTLAFVATSGIDDLKPALDKTILGQFLNDPNVRPVLDKVVALIQAKKHLDSSDPAAQAVLNGLKAAYRRPILAGVAQRKGQGRAEVYGYVLVDAGPSRDSIASALAGIEATAQQGQIQEKDVQGVKIHEPAGQHGGPVYWGWSDKTLFLGVNDKAYQVIQGLGARRSGPGLAALQSLPSRGDALVLHADLKALHGLVLSLAQESREEEVLRAVRAVSTELALSDLQTLAVRTGFQDKVIIEDGSLLTANPKGPLFGLIRPADPAMLDAADANTITASVWNLDLAGLYDLFMRTAKAAAPPQEYAELEKGLADAEKELGFRIRQDLLAGLVGPMAAFTVETPNSMPPTGGILMAKVTQPDAVDKALAALAKAIVDASHGSIQVGTTVQDGHTVRCVSGTGLALAQVMPTWVVAKDRLILATNTALCTRALAQWTSGTQAKTPLRETASYRQVLGTLPQGLVSLQYADTPRQFRQTLLALQPYWPVATVAAARAGIQLPAALPRFDRIVDRMPPSAFTCWQDKDGLRWRSEGHFSDTGAVAGAAVGAAIVMPAVARARTLAQRVLSMNNLKQIGLACIMYADAHNGSLPASLQSLVDAGQIQAEVLRSPRTPSPAGRPFYIYIAGQTTQQKDPALTIVAHEDPDQTREGVNALFLDGHVEFIRHEAFWERLEQTYKRLGREMPK